jgi:hypothetical protein
VVLFAMQPTLLVSNGQSTQQTKTCLFLFVFLITHNINICWAYANNPHHHSSNPVLGDHHELYHGFHFDDSFDQAMIHRGGSSSGAPFSLRLKRAFSSLQCSNTGIGQCSSTTSEKRFSRDYNQPEEYVLLVPSALFLSKEIPL